MVARSLLSAGSNAQGQLATGDKEDSHSFSACRFSGQDLGAFPDGTREIVQVACGSNHTLLLLDRAQGSSTSPTRELWGCGDGRKGQLGISYAQDVSSTSTSVFRPLNLGLQRLGLQEYTIRSVAASWENSYVVLSFPARSDVLLSMGSDDFGDLGIGGKAKAMQGAKAVHTVDFANAIPRREDGDDSTLKIQHLSTGPHHVIAHVGVIRADGAEEQCIVGWGTSRHGQLGTHKDRASGKPIPFLASPHSIFPPSEGGGPIVASALGTYHTVLLHASGRMSALGSDRKGQLGVLYALEDVSEIGCTWNSTYAVVRKGDSWSIISAGNHNKGQLGRPLHTNHNNLHQHPPLAVHFPFSHQTHNLVKMTCGSEHILCLFTLTGAGGTDSPATEVWGWGWNEHGNLGIGNTEDQDVPVRIWPPSSGEHRSALDIWAGYGTSWILV